MVLFILKSSACLAMFLMFYKLLLEKERMHIFKRYYLLAALVLALLIPSITFTDYVEVTPLPERYGVSETVPQRQHQIMNPAAVDSPTPIEASWAFDRAFIFWAIYIFGMLFSLLGFLKNLLKIARTVQDNPKLRIGALVNVLLQNCSVPHTFLNYVFLDKKKFETNAIPKEVLIHESTHAKQKHSLDVLFVELLQIVLWFNPLIYLIKKSIKLNHEFLADQAVLEHGTHIPQYQYLLLNFASSANCSTHQPSLANAFDYPVYSSIRLTLFGKTFTLGRNAVGQVKKRFSVMKKRTSKKSILARSILLLPLLAILLYSFTETEIIRKETVPNSSTYSDGPAMKTIKSGPNLISEGISDRSIEFAGLILDSETLAPLNNVEIRDEEGRLLSKTDDKGYYKAKFDKLHPLGELFFNYSLYKDGYKLLPQEEHWGDLQANIKSVVYFGLQKEGSDSAEFSQYISRAKHLSYELVLEKFPEVKARFEFNKKMEEAKEGNQDILIPMDDTYYLVNNSGWVEIGSKNDLVSINGTRMVIASEVDGILERDEITSMSPLDPSANNNALFAVYTIPENNPQEGASMHEVIKYNSLAKKYNAMPKEKRIIPSGDLKNLETIFRKMLKRQKDNAQPFPECPDPKSYEQEGATEKQMAEYNAIIKKLNSKPERARIIKQTEVDRIEYIHRIMTNDQREKTEIFPKLVDWSLQEGATEKQLDEYNALATKYNTMLADDGNIRIKKSEVDRLEYLHSIMTEEQRAEAEPFPNFPEPPEPPQPPVPPAPPSQDIEMEAQLEKQRAIMQEQEVEMRRQADRIKVQSEKRKEQQVQMQEQTAQMKVQRKKLSMQREKMEGQQKAMEEQRSNIKEQRMLMKKQKTEMEKQKTLGLEEAKIEENVIREIIEKQEIIAKEHPQETSPLWYLNEEGETKIYLEGKEISYSKMKQMEGDGMITSMNIIKKPNGNSLIKLNETGFRPQTPPVPPKPKSPIDLLEELKNDNVKIIFNGKEITYEMAEKVLENDTNINVKVNRENGKRPVMELSSE